MCAQLTRDLFSIAKFLFNNNNKFISSRQVQSVKQSEYKQRVLIIAYRRLPESYKLSMLATYDT